MSAQHAPGPKLQKLFGLPLGSRFRYPGNTRVYVLLQRFDSGLVADEPNEAEPKAWQGMYSAAETPDEFRELLVELVPVTSVKATGSAS